MGSTSWLRAQRFRGEPVAAAAGAGADLFVTADRNTIGGAFGGGGTIFLPNSNGATLQFVVVGQ